MEWVDGDTRCDVTLRAGYGGGLLHLPSSDLTGLGPCLGLYLCVHLEQKKERGRDSSCKGGSQPSWGPATVEGRWPFSTSLSHSHASVRPLLSTEHSALLVCGPQRQAL